MPKLKEMMCSASGGEFRECNEEGCDKCKYLKLVEVVLPNLKCTN